jgi:hypothetical protein
VGVEPTRVNAHDVPATVKPAAALVRGAVPVARVAGSLGGTLESAARADVTRRAATLGLLQRSVGNTSVARQLRGHSRRRRLARYEAGEHALFGAPGKTLKIGNVEVTEAELAAMGDFYKSPDAMVADATANEAAFKKLLADIRSDRELRAQGKEGIPEDTWVDDTKHRPKDEKYLDLAGANFAHFAPGKGGGPNFKDTWEALHKRALDLAHAAAAGNKKVPDEASRINAFAAHFLTDAFSAGHVIAKKDLMDRAQSKFDALKTTGVLYKENAFSKAVARGLLADGKVSAEFAKRELFLKGRGWGEFSQERTSVLVYGLRGEEPQLFFSLFARTVHDHLDEAIRKGDEFGLEVINDNGDVWTLAGDATLRLSPDTLQIATKAVEASRANLVTAASTTGPLDYEALFKAVWRFVPRPTTRAEHDTAVAAKKARDAPKPPEPPGLKSPRWGTPPNPTLVAAFEDRGRVREYDPDTDAVTRIQQALLDVTKITGNAYDLGPTGADGVFGAKTATAVRKFKTDESLGATRYGDVGPGTMHRLDELFNGAKPKPAGPVLRPGSREGVAQLDEAVTTYTDPGQQATVDEIVKLASEKLATLIGKLEEKGLTRLRKR